MYKSLYIKHKILKLQKNGYRFTVTGYGWLRLITVDYRLIDYGWFTVTGYGFRFLFYALYISFCTLKMLQV